MSETQILNTIKNLAKCQGFYGRLYEALMDAKNDPDARGAYDEFISDCMKCKDEVELVMKIEG